nr:helix-turn-helix domain-containing protein [uncultured Pedobacter sp.]
MESENKTQYDYEITNPGINVLLPYIHQYIYFRASNGNGLQKGLYPSDHVSLIFNFSRTKLDNKLCPNTILIGLHEDVHIMQSDQEEVDSIIIRFSSIGFTAFSKTHTHNITNKILDAKVVFGDAIMYLFNAMQITKDVKIRQDMLDTFFVELLKKSESLSPCYAELTNAIQSDPGYIIPETEDISYRHLSRMFKQIIGVNIQTYRRLARFEAARQLLIQETDTSLTNIGYQSGYYDQAHFAKEFKKLSGLRAKYFAPLCWV